MTVETPSRSGYALVTGGATRIGRAMVEQLAASGWEVAIHFRQSSGEAKALAEDIRRKGGRARYVQADLARADQLSDLFSKASAEGGFCSLLINSASIFEYDDISSLDAESLDRHYFINQRAPVLLAQGFKRQLPPDAHGLIIQMLDQKVVNLNPDFLSYTISKVALHSTVPLLAHALAPQIRVCGLAPGLSLRSGEQTDKGFSAVHGRTPLGYGTTPADVAQAMDFLVRSPAMTGHTLVVDCGQSLWKRSNDVMFSYRPEQK